MKFGVGKTCSDERWCNNKEYFSDRLLIVDEVHNIRYLYEK